MGQASIYWGSVELALGHLKFNVENLTFDICTIGDSPNLDIFDLQIDSTNKLGLLLYGWDCTNQNQVLLSEELGGKERG